MQTWPIRTKIYKNLVFAQKPSGINTHRPDPDKPGLTEWISEQLSQTVYPLHRLDKDTSGIMVFSLSKDLAAEMGALFESRQVKKKYLFLTDRKSSEKKIKIQSEIHKSKNTFVSTPSAAPNAQTDFQWLDTVNGYHLWLAEPETGKPHQIRLHAEQGGIPVLGDSAHGGSPFFRLALHAWEIQFTIQGETILETSPTWMNQSWNQGIEMTWQEALWNRTQFLDTTELLQPPQPQTELNSFDAMKPISTNVLRWSHHEIPEFRLDQYGSQLWMNWYASENPQLDNPIFEKIQDLLQKPLWIRQMKSRGSEKGTEAFLLNIPWVNQQQQSVTSSKEWIALENGVQYELRSDQGLSPGLFLDQRENRKWVRSQSQNKKVLNLFSYTGGFSLNAALGKASEVTTVDVSRVFIDWSQKNFKLNDLTNSPTQKFEFWVQDSLLFLKGCEKRQRKFDLIICDPPTLGRSKEGTFDLKRDFPTLFEKLWNCLEDQGQILFCFNYEGWSLSDLKQKILNLKLSQDLTFKNSPGNPFDFDWEDQSSLMKSLIIEKGLDKKS